MPGSKRTLNFTRASIDALPGVATRTYFNDTAVRGLQLQVTPGGAKSFKVYKRVNGRPQRLHLGTYPDLNPAQARRLAQQALGQIAAGEDPTAVRRAARTRGTTLADAVEDFFATRALKPKTRYDYEKAMARGFPDWMRRPLTEISKEAVVRRFSKLTDERGPADANLCMRILRSVLNFARAYYETPQGESLLPENPVARLTQARAWHRPKRRRTVIHRDDLRAWLEAVDSLRDDAEPTAWAVADWLTLLLFTGLRRTEGLALRWADVDLRGGTLTIPEPKNHEPHQLPLPRFVHSRLEARRRANPRDLYVFQRRIPVDGEPAPLTEPRAYLQRVKARSGVNFSPHDLRRTFATVAEGAEISPYALKRLLNHKLGQDVTAGYIVTDVERLRAPMARIETVLLEAAGLSPPEQPRGSAHGER